MVVYSILYEGDCVEAYSMKEFMQKIKESFCQNALKEQGHVTVLKENEKSRRWGTIVPHRGLKYQIIWDELEKMYMGAYGN
jgi:hypothetical protein